MIYYLVGLAAVSFYALLSPLGKKLMQIDGLPSFALIAITMGTLSLMALIASLCFEKNFHFKSLTGTQLSWIGLFSVINFIAFSLYLFVLRHIPVFEYQLLAMATPILAGILAYVLLKEPLYARYFIGLPIMAAGFLIAVKK